MEMKELIRPERKVERVTIRTTKSNCKWMADNKVSPSLLFNKAIEELISKAKTKKK